MLVKELQSLGLDIKVLSEDGSEVELSSIGDDDLEVPNIVSDENDITEDDVGESVETDDLYKSYQDENLEDGPEEPDDDVLFAADRGEYDFGDDLDDDF